MNKFICLLFFLYIHGQAMAVTRDINPAMGDPAISKILNKALPGDTLLFHPGIYKGPYKLNKVHGAENLPVIIRGVQKDQVVIDGQTRPGTDLDNQAFILQDCSWITIENLTIKNCWTDLIEAVDVSYFTLRDCNLTGGKRAVFATGRGSHHFLVENCIWEQDERVWTHEGDYSWEEIHHGIHKHYNGSIFQGKNISGVFVVRDNFVKNTFNAFRLSMISQGEMDLLACTNGEVYRNTVMNTSDNVFEPELHAYNLHFYHNRMINGHAFISITEVAGGEIYIYGNTAVSLPESTDGWTVFKISSFERSLTRPVYFYNNSWQVDFDIIGRPLAVRKNDYIRHFNNACFSEKSDSFGIYNLGLDNWFDYDCSNVPFPALLLENGFEKNGLFADPGFIDPYNNDFRLDASSACIDRGMDDNKRILEFRGSAPDIGAYDNGELVKGLPFRYADPELEVPFVEMPRIARHYLEGSTLRLWFSTPMNEKSLQSVQFRLSGDDGVRELKISGLSDDKYCLSLETGNSLEANTGHGKDSFQLQVSGWPEGLNGRPVTSWASTIPISLFKMK